MDYVERMGGSKIKSYVVSKNNPGSLSCPSCSRWIFESVKLGTSNPNWLTGECPFCNSKIGFEIVYSPDVWYGKPGYLIRRGA